MKYFMHRIQRAEGTFSKGIEIHDTLDSAVLSFWGRMKLGYNKTNNDYVSCKSTDENGSIVYPYDMTWIKEADEPEANKYFLHHIRKEGDTYDKDIDILDSVETAYGDFAAQMEYGYGNPIHPKVSFVSCYITDLLSGGMVLLNGVWAKHEEPTPEPEPEPEAEE